MSKTEQKNSRTCWILELVEEKSEKLSAEIWKNLENLKEHYTPLEHVKQVRTLKELGNTFKIPRKFPQNLKVPRSTQSSMTYLKSSKKLKFRKPLWYTASKSSRLQSFTNKIFSESFNCQCEAEHRFHLWKRVCHIFQNVGYGSIWRWTLLCIL